MRYKSQLAVGTGLDKRHSARRSFVKLFEKLEDRRLLAANPLTTSNNTAVRIFTATGTANVAAAQAAFEAAIGGANNGAAPPQQTTGFRDINWDGVKLDGTDFGGLTKTIVAGKVVGIPVDRFQARGAEFDEVYAVAGDGFTSVNPGVAGQLNAFSAKNIFGHFGDTDLGMQFVKPSATPSTPVQQGSRGFSAIFLDVEKANTSNIEFENNGNSLGTYYAPVGASGQPEFLGVLFSSPVITHVDVNPGTAALFDFQNGKVTAGAPDLTKGGTVDQAAVDNFDYAEPAPPVSATFLHYVEGVSATKPIATFSDTTAGAKIADFTATITWGDGTTSAGTVSGSAGKFTVNATHTYANEGTFAVSTKISDKLGNTVTSSAIATVADAPLKGTGLTITASHKPTFNGTVAKFTDGNVLNTNAADYTGTISWGDGTTSVASFVLTSAGNWSVQGSHHYSAEGTFTVLVTILDVGGSSTTATSHATVS